MCQTHRGPAHRSGRSTASGTKGAGQCLLVPGDRPHARLPFGSPIHAGLCIGFRHDFQRPASPWPRYLATANAGGQPGSRHVVSSGVSHGGLDVVRHAQSQCVWSQGIDDWPDLHPQGGAGGLRGPGRVDSLPSGSGLRGGGGFRHGRHQKGRIQPGLEPVHAPMQMRAGHPAGGAHLGNDISLPDLRALGNQDFTEMHVNGGDPVTMIDDQGATGIEHVIMGHAHHPIRRRLDRSSGGHGDVDAEMGPSRVPVEDALAAINATDPAEDRPDEGLVEIGPWVIPSAYLSDQRDIRADAGQIGFGGGRHFFRGQAVDALDVILAGLDTDGVFCDASLRRLHRQHGLRLGIPGKADHEQSIRRDANGPAFVGNPRPRRYMADGHAALNEVPR
ncbi:hypothetical protein DESC_700031 [Desulfosarcina cetonica]|nr:hypothetical protein DESC_700031 [Desulfosarcina cetonica]